MQTGSTSRGSRKSRSLAHSLSATDQSSCRADSGQFAKGPHEPDGLRPELIEHGPPVGGELIVQELIEVRHAADAVVGTRVIDAGRFERTDEPLAPVETNLNREGKPRLQPDMHQSELAVVEVVIQMQALAPPAFQPNGLRLTIASDPERHAGVDGRENTDASVPNAVRLSNPNRNVLIAEMGVVNVLDFTALPPRGLQRQPDQLTANVFGVFVKVVHGDFDAVKISVEPARTDDTVEDAAKQQSIKPGEDTHDTASEISHKIPHGVAS